MSGNGSTYLAVFGGGSTVLERVLLAIINAHTTQETEGRQAERLQTAMTALIGPVAWDGHDLERALKFMARHRQRDICDVEMGALHSRPVASVGVTRTVPELAKLAACQVLGCTITSETQATADLLCEMFRRLGKFNAVEMDHVREALENEAVQRIIGELAEWDVPARS